MYSNLMPYVPNRKPPMGAVLNPYLPINRGLVGFWPGWEGAGDTVEDSSGNGKYATAINGNSWSGGDISLSEQELLVKGGEYGALSLLSDFTVIWSCNVSDLSVDYMGIISQWGGDSQYREWALSYWVNTGALRLYIDDGSARNAQADTNLIVGKQDVRAVVFRRGVGIDFYKDGIPDGSPAFAYTPTLTTPRRAFIGAWGNDVASEAISTYEFHGTIRYMFIYNRTLAAREIAELSREPFCGFRWPNIIELASYVAAAGGIQVLRRRRAG